MATEKNAKPKQAKKTLLSGVNIMLVLGLLEEHGRCTAYFMTTELDKRSNGFISPKPSSITQLMQKLQKQGYVSSELQPREPGASGRALRPYFLTDLGRETLAREKEMWTQFNQAVHSILCF